MRQNDDWKNLWERTKTQLGLDEKDFPSNQATLEDLTQPELEENLIEAAQTVQTPPQPTKRQKASDKLSNYAEKVNRGHKGKRAMGGFVAGGTIGAKTGAELGAYEPALIGTTAAGALLGTVAANSDVLASMGLAEASHRLEPEERAATKDSYKTPRTIKHGLEEDAGPYAIKAFSREDNGADYVEIIDHEELVNFLDDLASQANNSWRMKNKEDHPLMCTGIDSEFHQNNTDIYSKRRRLAREVANAEDGPYEQTSVEEVLDVSGDPDQPETVPTEDYGTETNYQFAIISLDPEYNFDAENDWYDYSDLLSIEDQEEKKAYDKELETS